MGIEKAMPGNSLCKVSFYLHHLLEMTGGTGYLLTKNPHRGGAQEALTHIQTAQVLVGTEHRAEICPDTESMVVVLPPGRKGSKTAPVKTTHGIPRMREVVLYLSL